MAFEAQMEAWFAARALHGPRRMRQMNADDRRSERLNNSRTFDAASRTGRTTLLTSPTMECAPADRPASYPNL